MTDVSEIVRQLRSNYAHPHHGGCQNCYGSLMDEAADALERLSVPADSMRLDWFDNAISQKLRADRAEARLAEAIRLLKLHTEEHNMDVTSWLLRVTEAFIRPVVGAPDSSDSSGIRALEKS